MKKRLLSAALALAMALTLLPVSVFADYDTPASGDIKGDGTETVKYVANRDTNHDSVGWYVTVNYPANTTTTPQKPAKSVDVFLGAAGTATGLSVGGKYYNTTNYNGIPAVGADGKVVNKSIYSYAADNTTKTGLKGSVIVIGGSVSIDVVNATSIALDVYGGTATLTSSGSKLTTVTVNNSLYAIQGKGAIVLTNVASTLTSVTLNHVTWSDVINLNAKPANNVGSQRHSITLNDVAGSATITLDGTGTDAQSNPTSVGQFAQITNSTFTSLTTQGNDTTVNLIQLPNDGTATVSMTGTGGSFSFTNGGKMGALNITGSTTGDKNGNDLTTAPPRITIGSACTVNSINASGVNSERAGGCNTVQITGTVGGAVNLKNAQVTVPGGDITGAFAMETGTVTVSGDRATMAGGVKLAHDAIFTLTGSNCQIGALTVGGTSANAATVTFTVPTDPSNKLTSIDTQYTKRTISGGTWTSAVPKANLLNITYQLGKGSTYTYYNQDQLGEAVVKQGKDGGTLTVAGVTGTQTVTFKNGTVTWGVLTVAPGTQIPKLPTQMNDVNTPYWSDGKQGNLSGMYPTPDTGNVTLDAGGGGAVTGDATKLTGVTAKVAGTGADITAKLVGNVITLSGAVDAGQTRFNLELETDAVTASTTDPTKEVPVTIKTGVTFDPDKKTLSFDNPGTAGYALSNGVVVTDGFTALKLSNGTKYTLNCQGLNVRSTSIYVKGVDSSGVPTYPTDADKVYSVNDIEVIVNAPGYNINDTTKKIVIDAVNGSGAKIDFSKSPAVKRAINAALSTITDANVQQYIQAARQRAWNDNGIRGQALTATTPTGYNKGNVWLVPYLEVTVTDYKPTTSVTNSTLTANLSLKWRVEVHPENRDSGTVLVKDAPNVAKNGVYIAKTGTALVLDGDLRSGVHEKGWDLGGLDVKFSDYNGDGSGWVMHQGGIYGYSAGAQGFTMTHAVNGNLGTVVINKTMPLVTRFVSNANGAATAGRYESLQAAVDDTLDGQHIVVDRNYTGSMNINMTGRARQITVQSNGKNVVVANASGGLVTQNQSGSLYTIKLNRDNTVTVAVVDIAVSTATNGSVTSSINKAKVGDTVTFTMKPNAGYTGTLTAKTNNGTSVPVTNAGNNTFTIVVPQGATSVTVTPTFTKASDLPFTDVATTDSFYPAVKWNYEHNFIKGTTDTTFRPYNTITRAQLVTILYRNAGSPTVNVSSYPYTDINVGSVDAEMRRAIVWATSKNIVEGYGDGRFGPSNPVRNQELAKILYQFNVYRGKAPGTTSANLSNYFSDAASIASWARPYVQWAVANGVMTATSGKQFQPQLQLQRWLVAVDVYNYGLKFGA